jgi:preprotein translocase subunit Sss1
MFDPFTRLVVYVFEGLFVVGGVGCVIAIPIIAYKMFSVLFESDQDESYT